MHYPKEGRSTRCCLIKAKFGDFFFTCVEGASPELQKTMSLLISLYIKITAGAQGERSSSESTVTCVLGVTVSVMMDVANNKI